MNVTRSQILSRGNAGHCPNCGESSFFPPGAGLKVREQCPSCGLKFNRGEGFFLGPFVLNYGVTVFGYLPCVVIPYLAGGIARRTALLLAGIGILLLPLLLYRLSWRWWLTGYFYFLPQKLPKNHDDSGEDEEE